MEEGQGLVLDLVWFWRSTGEEMKRVGRHFSFVNCLIYPCFISFVNV